MWHFVHVVGPDFWPAFFFSLWHLVHNLFITYFFFSVPSAFNFAMLPDFCGNTEWHILQSPIRAWCWRWGKGTLPFVPPFISMFSAPLFWVAMELTTIAPAIMVKIDTNTTNSLSFIETGPWEIRICRKAKRYNCQAPQLTKSQLRRSPGTVAKLIDN